MIGGMLRTAVTVIVLVSAVAVSAQRTGTRIGRDATSKDGAAAMDILAACAIERRPDLVRQWLQYLPGTTEESALLRKWSDDLSTCMESDQLVMDGMELRFRPRMMRLPVAKALVGKTLRNAPVTSPASPTSEPWFMAKLNTLGKDAAVDRPALVLQDFGHCVAINRWQASRRFLLSEPDSAEQKQAVAELVPVLGPCLPQDAKISLTPANLRTVLAEPVYQIIAAAAPAAAQR